MSPQCPHAKTMCSWRDLSNQKSKRWNITASRVLFSNLVTQQDITFKRLAGTQKPNNVLEIRVRYPDMMNFPAEMSGLVKDRAGNDVFYQDHPCTQAFAEDIEDRKENDGYVYDSYNITFDEEQDPSFVSIGEANLTGFNLLRGKYVNVDKEVCDFKLLQILVKEKDLEENMSGTANMANCDVLGGQSNLTTRDGPFSPSKPVHSSPTPAPIHSSPTPTPVTSSDFLHRQQQAEIQQLRAHKAENERLQKIQGTREAMLKAQEKKSRKRSKLIQNDAFGLKFEPKPRSASATREPPPPPLSTSTELRLKLLSAIAKLKQCSACKPRQSSSFVRRKQLPKLPRRIQPKKSSSSEPDMKIREAQATAQAAAKAERASKLRPSILFVRRKQPLKLPCKIRKTYRQPGMPITRFFVRSRLLLR
jgi:hypothetical protein